MGEYFLHVEQVQAIYRLMCIDRNLIKETEMTLEHYWKRLGDDCRHG